VAHKKFTLSLGKGSLQSTKQNYKSTKAEGGGYELKNLQGPGDERATDPTTE